MCSRNMLILLNIMYFVRNEIRYRICHIPHTQITQQKQFKTPGVFQTISLFSLFTRVNIGVKGSGTIKSGGGG